MRVQNTTNAFLAAVICSSAHAFTSMVKNTKNTASSKLYSNKDDDMSIALPFAPRPKLLDGKMPGDVGFE